MILLKNIIKNYFMINFNYPDLIFLDEVFAGVSVMLYCLCERR